MSQVIKQIVGNAATIDSDEQCWIVRVYCPLVEVKLKQYLEGCHIFYETQMQIECTTFFVDKFVEMAA